MTFKFCPMCKKIVKTKVKAEGYKQYPYENDVVMKRRKISHLEEDGGCGHAWYTYEIPGVAVPGFESEVPPSEEKDE